jgi:hypothetical protein
MNGNTKIENGSVTRALVEEISRAMPIAKAAHR